MVVISKRNRFLTAPENTQQVNISRNTPVSLTTVKRRLLAAQLRRRIAAKKSLLKQRNKKKRLERAIQHTDWTFEQWHKVLWTDKSEFEE